MLDIHLETVFGKKNPQTFFVPYKIELLNKKEISVFETSFLFVAFCSFFPCSLTVFHRGRQRKSGVDNEKALELTMDHSGS